MTYRAPVSELLATMAYARGTNGGDVETATSILDEAATLASDLLGPLDKVGDTHGVTLADGRVRTAPGWPAAYSRWIEGGWNGLSAPEEAGGMALPLLLNAACFEIWSGANVAFALAGLLTTGAIEALHRHGSETLKRLFLPKLVSGEWPGTMNLTEPQAGSDLSGLKCRAERHPDGSYRITGQKIYITYGDHDMTDNIVHLVLARLPDAPAGTRGISLFLVPKILVDTDGRLGAANDVTCVGLERKLGMHGAPTCTMAFGDRGGATGYLIGEEHRGLACMFTMMNNARLAVGLQGVAAAEHATQKAIAFAQSRLQGKLNAQAPAMSAIIHHPDVARMLMTMKASTAAARCICYLTAAAMDEAKTAETEVMRREAAGRAALLTPVAKAFSTDMANEVASLGIQVHGGMGFIEETGAAQIMRDIRIAAIYEGTNGIQAIDLVTRKLHLDDGLALACEMADMRKTLARLKVSNDAAFGTSADRLTEAVDALDHASTIMCERLKSDGVQALATASPYLRLFALTRGGTALAEMALPARTGLQDADQDTDRTRSIALSRFFAEYLVPETAALARTIADCASALAGDPGAWVECLTH